MTDNYNDPGRGFMILCACFGIYWVISTIIDGVDLILNMIFR